ncbi:hypothetical protein OA010_03370 [Luminiphilus sp.]|nr:hypothetical protein [Luminiphilus sp.]
MTDKEDTDTRKIEKRRSWKEISSSATSSISPSDNDYAIELDLFERGEVDRSLWAKHLVEAKGSDEEAKWLYIKERAITAPARRAEEQRLREERKEREREASEQAARVAKEEARSRLAQARARVVQEKKNQLAQAELQSMRDRQSEGSEWGWFLVLMTALLGVIFLALL